MNTRPWRFGLMVPLLAAMGGCIVHDQVATLTLHPDGSGDLLIFRSNIRSTEEGERAESEMAEYRASFDGRTQDECNGIRESGARLDRAMWLREDVPLAHVIHVLIPSAAVLEEFATFRDADGGMIVTPKFSVSETHRRLALHVSIRSDHVPAQDNSRDRLLQLKRARALMISDLRIAVSAGRITDARGFVIASDGQSALWDEDEIGSLLRDGHGEAEIFLQWEVPD